MTILVTGATGLVGSHLLQALATSTTHTIKALYNNTKPLFTHSQVQWLQVNILDTTQLEQAMQNVNQVYHCAAIVSYNPKDKQKVLTHNITGTANVVNACLYAGVSRLIHVSSVAALGRMGKDELINENMEWTAEASNSTYSQSKYLAELEVWRGVAEGLSAACVNPSIILGAGNWGSSSTAIFKSVYNQFGWYTKGSSGFVDVNDVVKAMMLLMQSPITGERFIINGHNISYKNLFHLIAQNFNKKPPTKKAGALLSQIVWRVEAIKSWLTGKPALVTKETAVTAQAQISYNNSKFLQQFPQFSYTNIQQSVQQICQQLTTKYNLK